MIKAGYDFFGNICILKFPDKTTGKDKQEFAKKVLAERKNVSIILEKTEKVSGRLRTIKTRFLAGKKTKEALYRESGCIFKLNVDSCYFSPRLSNERLEMAGKIKTNDRVLVLFSGVAPFPIVIAKHSKPKKIVAVELGRECSKYALENVRVNKVVDRVEIIRGDVRRIDKLLEKNIKFEKIVMPRPQLKDSFLKYVWKFCKKNTEIYYYDFGRDATLIVNRVLSEAKEAGKNVRVIGFKKAGEIAPYKYRWRVDLKIL